MTVRVSQIDHCAFCVNINAATLLKHGVAMDKVEALYGCAEAAFSMTWNAVRSIIPRA
ncbi:MAG: hypothetical protein O2967_06295 [Proteobacteria bacterium]|nr:hypothetical protein [Pseudomonadota bacterium]